jgi:hypothetical protein
VNRFRAAILICSAGILAPGLDAVGAAAGKPGTGCPPGWSEIAAPSPGTGANRLHGIDARSDDDAWAVGEWNHAGSPPRTLTLHWDGRSWTEVPSPNDGAGTNVLLDVDAVGASDVWAVGYHEERFTFRPLVLHWDGAGWGIVDGPAPPSASQHILNGISAVSRRDMWSTGHQDKANGTRTLTEHWNGRVWRVVDSPNSGQQSTLLQDVSALSADDAWAVGYSLDGLATFAIHWNGSSWKRVDTPSPGPDIDILSGVDGATPDDVWAVGLTNTGSGELALIERWDGTSWALVSGPTPGIGSRLNDVAIRSATDAWAVGSWSDGSVNRPFIERWDGTAWAMDDPGGDPGMNTFLDAAAASGRYVWAAGTEQHGTTFLTHVQRHCQ